MKKFFIISLVMAISFGITGCGKKDKPATNKETVKTSALEWLSGEQSTECRIGSPDGEILIRAKGEKVRIDGVPVMIGLTSRPDGLGTNLMVDDMIYMWGDKKGTKIDNSETPKAGEQDAPEGSWKDMVKVWENMGFEYECKNINLSDDYFMPPADIEFNDLSQLMGEMEDIGAGLESSGDMDATLQAMEDMDDIMR